MPLVIKHGSIFDSTAAQKLFIFEEINTGAEAKLTYDTPVHPMRLVRLEDLG